MKSAKILLEKTDIRPSFQRVRILYYLMCNKDHPTAEKIYRDLLEETQTISKVTIYNTLNLLKENGLVRTIDLAGEETRYDVQLKPHAHFQCTRCGKLWDTELDLTKLGDLKLGTKKIEEVQLLFKGVCENCQNQKEKEQMRKMGKPKEKVKLYYLNQAK